jgi:hypothetical protein
MRMSCFSTSLSLLLGHLLILGGCAGDKEKCKLVMSNILVVGALTPEADVKP